MAGLALCLCGLQSFVMGIIGVLYAACILPKSHWKERSVWFLWLPTVLIVFPFGLFCMSTLEDVNAAFAISQAPGWNFHSLPSVDLFGFVSIGD